MNDQPPVLGVDFGGVIQGGSDPESSDDTTFLAGGFVEAMQSPAVEEAFSALGRLNDLFEGRVWIVSKCGPRIQDRTEKWLANHRFFKETGIDSSHLRFCRQRSEKADRCAELDVTHFVDDRVDVLGYLVGTVAHLFLFGSRSGRQPEVVGAGLPETAIAVRDWREAERRIRETLLAGSIAVSLRERRE